MTLVVNIGNTNIRFGIFKDDTCELSWIINTKPYRTSDEMYVNFKSMYHHYGINPKEITKIIIGSVVPPITANVREALEKLHKTTAVVVDRETPSSVIHHSNQIGTDLYANAVGAQALYPQGNKIVVDFGTALTFTGINQSGELLGVVIAPGVHTSLTSLVGNTAQLSSIELKKPETILGQNTEHCMQSGMIYGFVSMVEGMIQKIKHEIHDPKALVIATGGLASIYAPLTQEIAINDSLHTLKGLYYLGNKN